MKYNINVREGVNENTKISGKFSTAIIIFHWEYLFHDFVIDLQSEHNFPKNI